MTAREMIDRRRSVRSYTDTPLAAEERATVEEILASLPPLLPDLRLAYELLPRAEVHCRLPLLWLPPDILTVYAGDELMSLVNIGFRLSRLDLALQARGLGTCWLGLCRPRAARERQGLPFAMMMAIGHPKGSAMRNGPADFSRHAPGRIADRADERLEPARLAPSAVNGQPWFFTHEGDTLRAFCSTRRSRLLHAMNRIDVGIALGHLAEASGERFAFWRDEEPPSLAGHQYIGSFTL